MNSFLHFTTHKKLIYLIMVLFSICLSGFYSAQNIDSLKLLFKAAKSDSTRCLALEKWGNAVQDNNPDTALILYRSVIPIAQNALKKVKKGTFEHLTYTYHIAVAYNDLGVLYKYLSEKDSAIFYLTKGAALLEGIYDQDALGDNYANLSSVYEMEENYAKAIAYGIKSLKVREEIKDTMAMISSLNNLGYFYALSGNIVEALNHYKKCLNISELKKDKNGIAMSLLNIASNLYKQGEKKESLDYYLRSYKLMEDLDNRRWMGGISGSIGVIYFNDGKYEQALIYFKKAIASAEQVQAKDMLATVYNDLGNLYIKTNKLDSALIYLNEGKTISTKINNNQALSRVLTSLSKVMLLKGNISEALELGNKGLSLAQEISNPESISKAAENLKAIYLKKGDPANALKMFELFVQMRDSLHNQQTRKAAVKTQLQYEYDKKEALLKAQAESENLVAAQKNENQKILTGSVSSGLILVFVFAIIIFNRLRVTRSQKELIDKKNKENELLLGEIHHRVKNNLQVISSLLSLQERSIKDKSAKSAILEGKERVKSMELVHKMLYQENKFSGIEMNAYVNKLTAGLMESYGLDPGRVGLNAVFKPMTLDVDTAVPLGLILNELLVNSLKHARDAVEKLELYVNIHLNGDNELEVSIADNGKGKLTDVERSDSFGLKIVRALVRQLEGVLKIDDENGLRYDIIIKNYRLII